MNMPSSIIIELPGGKISAASNGDLVRARGLRYASASRFQRPKPVEKWDEIADCTGPAPICPQIVPFELDFVTGPITAGREQSEDCLHVSVTTTVDALSDGRKRPVMVFLHGGAYVSGGADLDCYEPSGLVERGVVGVNISYRLGIFGFQPIPDVAPANLGLMDQIEALRWIQRNIAAFGGDSNNVTVFGQSAGAASIHFLMIADGTEGLFHRAIIQSAPLEHWTPEREKMVKDLGILARDEVHRDSNTQTSGDMLLLQQQLFLVAESYGSPHAPFKPLMGSEPLPDQADVAQRISQVAKRVPMMIGYTKDEGVPFVRKNDTLRPYLALAFIGSFIEWIAAWFIGKVFTWFLDGFHKEYRRAGGTSILYRFNWRPIQSSLRAPHCIELPFLLGSWSSWKAAPMLGGMSNQHAVEELGDRMKGIWIDFARGNMDKEVRSFTIKGNQDYWEVVFR
ncbi:carboxylesterase type b [Colletotrichum truncatum]|uniref:Carboxylesterase type b n=1 Tax=Colletotrichum truncatum TaxID=5467 RepID=A0ACC3YDK0_COLTU|nr:carboxylesterase type b [Colletotrichum truncatum]KAF6783034.1 carboxylesterase type b [Colletotrichum truncatum]